MSVTAFLHIFAFVRDGLNASAGMMLGIRIVYILMVIGLRRNLRSVAWMTFLAMPFGAGVAYMVSGGGTELHNGWFLTIAFIDHAAAILLFVCLWRSKQRSQQA